MEAEIGSDGTVLVEGHLVGELQGFRFTPDVKSDGPDAKAVRAAAQKALAGEYDKRAERFFNAPNGDLALGSDALVRWLGAPIASLTAGEDPLRPRIVVLADDQLAGPARDKVSQRVERFVTYQISTILKPLADLREPEGVDGTARGIAFRLYENFGLIQRRDISEEVRGLDQDARAALRRLGVRFGAYHIFLPALVKPAPAALMTLLWAVANDGRDRPGFGEVTQLLATGRTSVQPDATFDPIFYSLAGYRLLGRRAVRVDILERLADLIRPALAWTPGSGKRPDGAYNGREFLVTPSMMSILGATADDMDEILKGLGYRSQGVEQREVDATFAKQDEAAAAALVAGQQAATVSAEDAKILEEGATLALAGDVPAQDGIASETEVGEPLASADSLSASDLQPAMEPGAALHDEDLTAVTGDDPRSVDSILSDQSPSTAGDVETESAAAVSDPVSQETPVETALSEASPEDAGTVADLAPEQPAKMVQLWRPFRGENRQRGQGRGAPGARGPGRHGGGGRSAGPRAGEADATSAPAEGRGDHRQRFGRGGGQGRNENGRSEQGGEARPQRFGGKGGERRDGGSRDHNREGGREREERFGGPRGGKPHGKPDRDAPRTMSTDQRRPEKQKPIDPDSPFAKLAALKDKLK